MEARDGNKKHDLYMMGLWRCKGVRKENLPGAAKMLDIKCKKSKISMFIELNENVYLVRMRGA